ncbi:MAG: glycosyltransferase [Actinobacteria bacterium]|nr:glycosyltransferase [Actinomycetota bacterium]
MSAFHAGFEGFISKDAAAADFIAYIHNVDYVIHQISELRSAPFSRVPCAPLPQASPSSPPPIGERPTLQTIVSEGTGRETVGVALPERADIIDLKEPKPISPLNLAPIVVSVVIPTLNEGSNIGWVLGRIPPFVGEVILVDGNSTDDTVAEARAVRPDVVVIQSAPGKGAALRAGFAAACGQIIVMIDADGSMDPIEIPRYLGLLSSGVDFVKGSRFSCGAGSTDITTSRRIGNWALLSVVNLFYRARFSDLCYGFCAFTREALDAMHLDADGFEIETQIAVRALEAKLRIAEVPSLESDRLSGESKLRPIRDGMRILHVLLQQIRRSAKEASLTPALSLPSPPQQFSLRIDSSITNEELPVVQAVSLNSEMLLSPRSR